MLAQRQHALQGHHALKSIPTGILESDQPDCFLLTNREGGALTRNIEPRAPASAKRSLFSASRRCITRPPTPDPHLSKQLAASLDACLACALLLSRPFRDTTRRHSPKKKKGQETSAKKRGRRGDETRSPRHTSTRRGRKTPIPTRKREPQHNSHVFFLSDTILFAESQPSRREQHGKGGVPAQTQQRYCTEHLARNLRRKFQEQRRTPSFQQGPNSHKTAPTGWNKPCRRKPTLPKTRPITNIF